MEERLTKIIIRQPTQLAFGCGVSQTCLDDIAGRGIKRLFILYDPYVHEEVPGLGDKCIRFGIETFISNKIMPEPTVEALETVLVEARTFEPDGVLGIGGGSTLDLAKLVSVLLDGKDSIYECFEIGKITGRNILLFAMPTTAGTGSEVTPIAVITDTKDKLKKGVVSPYLIPDAVYVDPDLTLKLPPEITATTGMDALTHCIEVYTNKHAHPMIDLYALEGIRLIGVNLEKAVREGSDRNARSAMSLASLYGGLGLGPVSTAAVHALAYPLGGEFHIAHGVANALLLPHVLHYNYHAVPERYAPIAKAMGVSQESLPDYLQGLSVRIGIPQRLRDLNISEEAIPRMAQMAMDVKRLMDSNPREMTVQDAIAIYRKAF